MKKIKIIGIITILIIICECVFHFADNMADFNKGRNDARRGLSTASLHTVTVQPTIELRDSLYNKEMGHNVPYSIMQVETSANFPGWVMVIMPFACIAVLCYLYGFYALIRLLISVSRRDVFTKKNVWRLRFFVYAQAAAMGLFELFDRIVNYYVVRQLQMPGYEVKGGAEYYTEWMLLALTILLAEIFAVGVKFKEEQDLTI